MMGAEDACQNGYQLAGFDAEEMVKQFGYFYRSVQIIWLCKTKCTKDFSDRKSGQTPCPGMDTERIKSEHLRCGTANNILTTTLKSDWHCFRIPPYP
jgi:hypothetical protein